ncbi:MAG: hypothetical protein KDD55_08405 [Bdellovibrionales bacterium]|nr:hypothetical protein [Bdellovibrionales bacterium]
MSELISNRVPKIILLYWVIKISSTTLGETGADMFSMTFDLGYGVTILIFLGIFLSLLAVKLKLSEYNALAYWSTFTASAIAGTAICDFIDRTLGLGYTIGSVLLLLLLGIVLVIWHLTEGSLSVERITSNRHELFYWLAFLVANTLGTAAGDSVADDLELGFMLSAGIFSALLLAIVLMHYFTKISWIVLFWLAFVLTRPFGATFGDFLTKPISEGGLNLGTIGASLFFLLVMLAALAWESKHKKEVVETVLVLD